MKIRDKFLKGEEEDEWMEKGVKGGERQRMSITGLLRTLQMMNTQLPGLTEGPMWGTAPSPIKTTPRGGRQTGVSDLKALSLGMQKTRHNQVSWPCPEDHVTGEKHHGETFLGKHSKEGAEADDDGKAGHVELDGG